MNIIARLMLSCVIAHYAVAPAMASQSQNMQEKTHEFVKVLKKTGDPNGKNREAALDQAVTIFSNAGLTVDKGVTKYAAHKIKQAFFAIKDEWHLSDNDIRELMELHKRIRLHDQSQAKTLNNLGGRTFFEINSETVTHFETKNAFIGSCPVKKTIIDALDSNNIPNIIFYKNGHPICGPLHMQQTLIFDAMRQDGVGLLHQIQIECEPESFASLSPLAQQGLCTMEIESKIKKGLPTVAKLVEHRIAQKNPQTTERAITMSQSVQKLYRALNKGSFLTNTCKTGPQTHDHILQLLKECPSYRFMLGQPLKRTSGSNNTDVQTAHAKRVRDTSIVVDLLKIEASRAINDALNNVTS